MVSGCAGNLSTNDSVIWYGMVWGIPWYIQLMWGGGRNVTYLYPKSVGILKGAAFHRHCIVTLCQLLLGLARRKEERRRKKKKEEVKKKTGRKREGGVLTTDASLFKVQFCIIFGWLYLITHVPYLLSEH